MNVRFRFSIRTAMSLSSSNDAHSEPARPPPLNVKVTEITPYEFGFPVVQPVLRIVALLNRMPAWLLGLVIRIGIADVFWRSGQTKVSGWHVTDTTIQLFRDEYKVPLIPPDIAAYLAAIQEHLFSILLVVGLASRLSAFGLCA